MAPRALHTARRAATCLLLGALLASPATAAVAAPDELDRARGELEQAERSSEQLREDVAAATAELARLQDALLAARAQLATLEEERTAAEEAHATSLEHVDDTRAEVARRDQALADTLARWNDGRRQLADQVVHAYKHGNGLAGEVLVRGVVTAGDWHEVAVTLTTVERLASDGRDAVDRDARDTREIAQLRAAADQARAQALVAARAAGQEADEVTRITAAAAATTARIDADEQARRAALAGLEADAQARATLVAELEATVARLELDAQRVFVPIDVDLDPFGPPPAWGTQLPGDGPRWSAAIEATAARNGIDGRLFAALVWSESNFSPGVVSHAGALGLAQLMPGTARGLGVDPRDPLDNLDGGARYLRTQLETFGRVDLALAAYNAGPGRVQRAGGIPDIVETQVYVQRVLDRYERLGG